MNNIQKPSVGISEILTGIRGSVSKDAHQVFGGPQAGDHQPTGEIDVEIQKEDKVVRIKVIAEEDAERFLEEYLSQIKKKREG
jgi:hypothetical protein